MSKNGFNDEQNLALDNPIDINLLISAGAGSGKTKTLSEKVMRLIENGLKPSELLILTFTNNAAHEMKSRIIAKFKDNKEIAYQLASAHIQTFDSFSQYLVSAYSSRLKISEQISILQEDIIKTKKREFLDEIFDEYYCDSDKKRRLLSTLLKFNLKDDSISKAVILDLIDQIEKLSLTDQDRFLNHYEENFLSDDFFMRNTKLIADEGRRIIKEQIYKGYFIEKHFEMIENVDVPSLKQLFEKKDNFNIDIEHLNFVNEELAQPLYEELIKLLKLNDLEFINKVRSFTTDHPEINNRYSGSSYEKKYALSGFKEMRILFATKDSKLLFIQRLDELENEYNKILSFKDDIALYLEIVKKVNDKIAEYKKVTNSYLFSDISNMALSLLIDPQYEDVAEEIRSRFKFIMVDEYQDTNDLQEAFINSLLKENKKGERSHLFCVGDAKQSIYAFRNSNVQLFRDRQNEYLKSDDSKAISMNKNYRSGEQLLKDINYIFKFYMTINHGAISYHQISETLQYDKDINLYNKPYDDFGIHRITSISSINYDGFDGGAKLWEARAIAYDIKQKVDSHFLVSRRTSNGNVVEPCDYDDFAILVGKKSCVDLYQKVFQEMEIPLNCTLKNDLNEIDAITVIQSLLNLMDYILEDKTSDTYFVHLFASVARSYLFEYNDQQLFDILFDPSKQYVMMNNDPIIIKVMEFVNNHKNSGFSQVFLDLIDEFGVIEKLYKIGNVDDVVSKIESLYQFALSSEKSGGGLKDFIDLMSNIKKYDLDLNSESLFKVSKAVDLMTIHGSKGLEEKIVYMPVSFNQIEKGNNMNKPDYAFSKNFGILLPYYFYEYKDVPLEDAIKEKSVVYSLSQLLYQQINEEKKIGIDEHVRLFYVALTRAENSVYIVGDVTKLDDSYITSSKKKDNLYGMMSYAPYYPLLDNEYMLDMISKGAFKKDIYDLYLKQVENMRNINISLTSDDLDYQTYDLYSVLFKECYVERLFNQLLDSVSQIEKDIFAYYFPTFTQIIDLDELARLFALYFYKDRDIKSKQELLDKYSDFNNVNDDEDDDDDDSDNDELPVITEENVDSLLNLFKEVIVKGTGLQFLNIKETKELKQKMFNKQYGDIPIGLTKYLLPTFALYFSNQRHIKSISFETSEFLDRTHRFDINDYKPEKTNNVIPKLESISIDDSHIEFDIRKQLRASKSVDEELPSKQILDFGIKLHRLMELTDLKTKDTSFIIDKHDKYLIDNVLKLDVFKDSDNAEIFKEFGYFDDELNTTGFIDLLIKKDDEFIIIDYKAKHVVDEGYTNQLHAYARNINRLFNTTKIKMYLLSIVDHQLYEVK